MGDCPPTPPASAGPAIIVKSWQEATFSHARMEYIQQSFTLRNFRHMKSSLYMCILSKIFGHFCNHGLRTPGEEIAFTARLKINSHYQIFRWVQPKHILSATSAQNFRFLWFLPSLGVRSPCCKRMKDNSSHFRKYPLLSYVLFKNHLLL